MTLRALAKKIADAGLPRDALSQRSAALRSDSRHAFLMLLPRLAGFMLLFKVLGWQNTPSGLRYSTRLSADFGDPHGQEICVEVSEMDYR
jgi:hypothetical protein